MTATKELIEIDIPAKYRIMKHRFHNYDPATEFSEDLSFEYLSEDLFQVKHRDNEITIDLGWYGDLITNEVEFAVRVILKTNWESPITTMYSKSQPEIATILQRTIQAVHDGVLNFEPEKE